jgi:hypothetical protein
VMTRGEWCFHGELAVAETSQARCLSRDGGISGCVQERRTAGPSATLLMTQVRASQVECRTYGAQIILGIEPQPFRAGLTFSCRPSGPRIHGDFAVSFLSQLAIGKLAAPNDKPKTGVLRIPNLRCRCRRQGHCSLNLPQARWLLGMTKGESGASIGNRRWLKELQVPSRSIPLKPNTA